MDVAKLIAAAAKQSLEEYPTAIGVRFSPISLSAADIERVPDEVRRLLGPGTYVAASAPGVRRRAGDHVLIVSDHTAAEQATAWRNSVRVGKGERLVYVSVEEHGKASGLRDCLLAVSEAGLVETLLRWMESESNLPKGLASALREAALHESRSIAALTEFACLANSEGPRSKAWASVSKSLPALGLAKDSGLKGAEDAADRLRANAKLVASALTGEARRRAAGGPMAEVEERLRRALRDAPAVSRAAVLASIDLGDLKTSALGPKPKRPKPKRLPEPPAQKKGRAGKASDAEKAGDKGQASRIGKQSVTPVEPPPEPRRRAPAASVSGEPVRGAGGESIGLKLHAPPLPEGVAALLGDLHRGPGGPVRLAVTRDARACLITLPRVAEREILTSAGLEQRVGEPFSRWADARRVALAQVETLARRPEDVSALLVGALPQLVAQEAAGAALRSLLDAELDLFRAALIQDPMTQLEVLRLDTAEVTERGAVMLRLLGPLHMLWLSQALARGETLSRAKGMAETARRLLSRAATAAPAAPQAFPESDRDELRLARPEAALIVYERVPDAVVGQPVAEFAEALVRRYLELCPHACLGLRVALLGGDEAAFLDGLARAAAGVPELERVEVLCARPPRLDRRSVAAAEFEAGRVRVDALPIPSERLSEASPHIVVHFRGAPADPEDEEPSPPGVAGYAPAGAAASSFEIRRHSLRVRTPVEGRGVAAFEALHASARGRKQIGAFISDHTALSLKSVTPQSGLSSTWHAVVAPSVGGQPPLGFHLIAHEAVEAAQCAVISRDLRPLTRALQEGLRQIGVAEHRPNVLRSLGAKLSDATSAALLSLRRPGTLQLLAGVLSLELARQADAQALIVPVDPEHLAALAGEPVAQSEQLFMLAVWPAGEKLAVRIGFATADPNVPLDLSRPTPGARVGKLAAALAEVWQMAARGSGDDGAAAREFLNWIIWPALAAEDGGPPGVQEAMRSWRLCEEATGGVFLIPPQSTALTGALRGKRAKVSVLTLEPALLNKLLLSS